MVLRKHKYDVFRLLQIVTDVAKVKSEGLVTERIHRYIEEISLVDESEVRLLQMGLPFDRDQGVELLKGFIYKFKISLYDRNCWKYLNDTRLNLS